MENAVNVNGAAAGRHVSLKVAKSAGLGTFVLPSSFLASYVHGVDDIDAITRWYSHFIELRGDDALLCRKLLSLGKWIGLLRFSGPSDAATAQVR